MSEQNPPQDPWAAAGQVPPPTSDAVWPPAPPLPQPNQPAGTGTNPGVPDQPTTITPTWSSPGAEPTTVQQPAPGAPAPPWQTSPPPTGTIPQTPFPVPAASPVSGNVGRGRWNWAAGVLPALFLVHLIRFVPMLAARIDGRDWGNWDWREVLTYGATVIALIGTLALASRAAGLVKLLGFLSGAIATIAWVFMPLPGQRHLWDLRTLTDISIFWPHIVVVFLLGMLSLGAKRNGTR